MKYTHASTFTLSALGLSVLHQAIAKRVHYPVVYVLALYRAVCSSFMIACYLS